MKGLTLAAVLVMAATLAKGLAAEQAAEPARLDIGSPAPNFSAYGADGRQHHLSDHAGRIVVLEWTSPLCPFTAAKYKSGAMQALQRYAAKRHVVWLSVNTAGANKAGYLTPAAARVRIAKTRARITGFLFDTDGDIGRSYGARTTPSFFIVGSDGKLAYQGAMDNETFGPRPDARHYMKLALDDLAAGRSLDEPETVPEGCAVEY